jgi:hypothetical protein
LSSFWFVIKRKLTTKEISIFKETEERLVVWLFIDIMCVYYLILLKTNVFQDFLFNNNTFCLKWYSIVCNSWLLITLWYSHFITRWSFTLISSHVGHLKKKIVVFLNNSFQIWLTPCGVCLRALVLFVLV